MNITTKLAEPSDAITIANIGRLSFRDAFSNLFESKKELQEYLDLTYNISKIEKSIRKENNIYFIASMGTVPVGFAKLKKSSLESQIESIAQMELQKIYVLRYYHGSGAGAALMNAVLEFTCKQQPDHLWLHVHVSNQRALRFYQKNGFTIAGKHSFIIGTQSFDFHLMSLPIAVLQPCG